MRTCELCKQSLEPRPVLKKVRKARPPHLEDRCGRCSHMRISHGHSCEIDPCQCFAFLEVGALLVGATTFVERRVHCKPLQLVIVARVEGSIGIDEDKGTGVFETRGIRVCVDCFRGKKLGEVLAVAIDHLLDEGR